MYLSGPATTAFQLNIVGYEFPHIEHERFDSDWLNIEIRVVDPRGNWSSTAPIMLTWDVAELADWLEALASDQPTRSSVSFIEPNLRFELAQRDSFLIIIRVYFEQESRPPWDPTRSGFSGGDVTSLDLHPTLDSLRQAAADLRLQLRRFPIRVGPDRK
jgi:hypothetical protein